MQFINRNLVYLVLLPFSVLLFAITWSCMSFVRSLADQPQTPGDFTDTDESQRTRQIKVIGDYG